MKAPMRLIAGLLLIIGFAGCATFNQREMAVLRSRGVSGPVLLKLERNYPLTPPEIIGLSQRGVPQSFLERHIEAAGADYLVTREDVVKMRRGGVSARVIDALIEECDEFAWEHSGRRYDGVRTDLWWTHSVHFGPGYYHPWW